MAQRLSQKGFGALGVLLVLAVLGFVIGAGIYVFGRNQATERAANFTNGSAEQKPLGTIEFPQLGVKMKLSEEIKDIQYVFMQRGEGSMQDHITFTSKTVRGNASCGTDTASLGSIRKFELSETVEVPSGERFLPAELGAVKVGDHLYLYESPRDSCLIPGNNIESDAALKKQLDALKEAAKTLESI